VRPLSCYYRYAHIYDSAIYYLLVSEGLGDAALALHGIVKIFVELKLPFNQTSLGEFTESEYPVFEMLAAF
jgi:hypothetical protein